MKELFKRLNKSEIRNSLALVTVLGCFSLLGIMLLKPIPPENKDIINIALGFVFGGLLAGVSGYYFGASKNESDIKSTNKKDGE